MKPHRLLTLLKLVITLIILFIQLLILYLHFTLKQPYGIYMDISLLVFQIIFGLYIISQKKDSAYKITWIMFVLVFPVMAILYYLVFGNINIQKQKVNSQFKGNVKNNALYESLKESNKEYYAQAEYLYQTSSYPIYQNTEVMFLKSGEEYFSAMLIDLKQAKKYIVLSYFILSKGELWKEIYDVLVHKAKEGVKVYILIDDLGSLFKLPKGYRKQFYNSKIMTETFSLFGSLFSSKINFRHHRKLTIIDGKIGYIGGVNIADEYINIKSKYGHWNDSGVRLEGEAVRNLVSMFIEIWNLNKPKHSLNIDDFITNYSIKNNGYVLAYADGPNNLNNPALNTYIGMIESAKESVFIMTPYLILSDELVNTIIRSAKRGVEINIIMPHIPDKRLVFMCSHSYYQELLEAGVHIYEYKLGFIHDKICLVDNQLVVVGTINFDYRSFYLHYECGVWMYKTGIEVAVKDNILRILSQSIEITLEDWNKYKVIRKIMKPFLTLLAPLL